MKNFKKTLSCFVAAATIISSVGITVSADYDVCDVNKDGFVNVRDAQAISRYLAGNLYEMNYQLFDVDKSLVVDKLDIDYIMSKIAGNSCNNAYLSRKTGKYTNASEVSLFVPDPDTLFNNKREYIKYTYATGKQDEYTLIPTDKKLESNSNNQLQMRTPIGNDDRYKLNSNENTGIVNINAYETKTNMYTGTGFIVGDHQIATCAHMVYDNKNSNDWYKPIKIYTYNSNGERNNTTLTAVEAHIPKEYTNTTMPKFDYALITVKEDLSQYTQYDLGMSYSVTEKNFSNIPLYVTGCPGTVNNTNNSTNHLYTGEGRIIDNGCVSNQKLYNLENLHFDVDASPGDSGSPLYVIIRNKINNTINFKYVALGIASYESKLTGDYNSATRVTKYLLQFYKNNPNIIY